MLAFTLKRLGLAVLVTLTVSVISFSLLHLSGNPAAALAGEFLSNVLAVPAVRLIATWQLSDRYSWYRSLPRKHMFGPARMPRPLPFDDDGRPKPMRQAMIEAFRARAAGAGRPTP